MSEPLYMQLKIAHDKLLDVATREVKDHKLIADCADEVAGIALGIANKARDIYKKSEKTKQA